MRSSEISAGSRARILPFSPGRQSRSPAAIACHARFPVQGCRTQLVSSCYNPGDSQRQQATIKLRIAYLPLGSVPARTAISVDLDSEVSPRAARDATRPPAVPSHCCRHTPADHAAVRSHPGESAKSPNCDNPRTPPSSGGGSWRPAGPYSAMAISRQMPRAEEVLNPHRVYDNSRYML